MHVGFVGTGLIGKVTVAQMAGRAPQLRDVGLDIRITGATDSKSMIVANGADGMSLSRVEQAIGDRVSDWDAVSVNATISDVDLDAFVNALQRAAKDSGGAAVVVDNTSSDAVASLYQGT
jgi:homoserine dehydrogenase